MKTGKTYKERVAQIIGTLVAKGISQAKIARTIGASRQAITNWLSPNIDLNDGLKAPYVLRLTEMSGYSPAWLVFDKLPERQPSTTLPEGALVIRGDQKMELYYCTAQESALLSAFRRLQPGRKDDIMDLAEKWSTDGAVANVVSLKPRKTARRPKGGRRP